MKMKFKLSNRIFSFVLALVLVLGMVPISAKAAVSQSLTVSGLTYTLTVQSATDKDGNNRIGDITGILLYGTPSRSGSQITFQAYMTGYMSLATYKFTETNCTDNLTATTSAQMGNGNKVVLSITRSAASHTGGTCMNPVCTRCGTQYDAPHDYKWRSDGTYHWQECTRDASHTANHAACSGGTATCKTLATCSTCKKTYGKLNADNHEWSEWDHTGYTGATRHFRTCDCRENVREVENCNPLPNCTYQVMCSKCGTPYPAQVNNHSWGNWQSNGNGTHTRICTLNSGHKETQNCSGDSSATCQTAGTCTTCGGQYKNPQAHSCAYSADGSTLTQTCDRGCGHSATATLQLKSDADLTYTGSVITPMEMVYQEGWVGEKKQPAASDYSNNLNAGTATVKTTVEGKEISTTFEIAKKTLDMSMVTMEHASGTYNGSMHSTPTYTLTYNGNPLALDTDYTAGQWSGDFINAGSYTLMLEGKGNFSGALTLTYNITKAEPTARQFQNGMPHHAVYDGSTAYSATIKSNANGMGNFIVKYNGSTDAPINAGNYTVTVDVAEGTNYKAAADVVLGGFVIDKADGVATVSIEGWEYGGSANAPISSSFTNDGTGAYQYKVKGADDTTYTNEVPTEAGAYTVKATFAATTNYLGVSATADFEIVKADPGIGAVSAAMIADTLETSAIVLVRENTTVEGILTVDAEQSLSVGDNVIAYTFTPNDTANYKTVTGTVPVTVIDTVAPTGTVSISTKSWAEFLNKITFNLFFKETQAVSVMASDNLSGVAKIEFIESKTAMDLAAVKAADQWTEMENGSVSVTREDTKQFIYYIRLTDKAGNVTYLSSDGAEYDATAPVIEGVNNGATYYTTQVVTITDKNIDTITLNGEDATGSITLEGNKEATYNIVATDKAGNVTTYTVKMAPIADITDSMEGKTDANVTSDDKTALQAIVDTATELLNDEDMTAEEKAELEQAKADAEAMLDAIDEAAKAADTENTAKVEDVTAENVTSGDKGNLEDAKADLEKALKDKAGNYTEEEKLAIQGEIDRIDDSLEVIENAEAVEETISELPEAVKPEDEEAVEKVDAAKKAYEQLTEHEKSLIGKDTVEKLAKLMAAATDYEIIAGNGSKWTKDSESALSFTANGSFRKFAGIAVNGKEVAMENYEAKAGSTVITLKSSYLNTLKPGKYEFAVVYTDGAAEGTFIVEAKVNPAVPGTGDDSNIMLYGSMFTVSLAAIVVLLLASRKRKQENA